MQQRASVSCSAVVGKWSDRGHRDRRRPAAAHRDRAAGAPRLLPLSVDRPPSPGRQTAPPRPLLLSTNTVSHSAAGRTDFTGQLTELAVSFLGARRKYRA